MGYEDLEQKLRVCSDDSAIVNEVVSFLHANPEPVMSTGFLLLISNYVSRTVESHDRDFAKLGLAYCKEVLKRNEPLSVSTKRLLYADAANLCWHIADLTRRPANKLKYLLKAYKYRSKIHLKSHVSAHYSTSGRLAYQIAQEYKKVGDSKALKWLLISAKNKCNAGEQAEASGKQEFAHFASAANRFFDAYQFSLKMEFIDKAIFYAEKGAVFASDEGLAELQLNLGKFYKTRYDIFYQKSDWHKARYYYGEAQEYFETHSSPNSNVLISPIKRALESLCTPRPVDHDWHRKQKWVHKKPKREDERKIIESQMEDLG